MRAKVPSSVLSGAKTRAKVPSSAPSGAKTRVKVFSTVVRKRYMCPFISFRPCPSKSLCTPLVVSEYWVRWVQSMVWCHHPSLPPPSVFEHVTAV